MTSPTTPGQQSAAISRLLVSTVSEYVGRGPTQVKTTIGVDTITVVLDDIFTKAEKRLILDGEADRVLGLRRAIQQTMKDDLVSGVEEITGRTVIAFLSDNHINPDLAVEIFLLAPR